MVTEDKTFSLMLNGMMSIALIAVVSSMFVQTTSLDVEVTWPSEPLYETSHVVSARVVNNSKKHVALDVELFLNDKSAMVWRNVGILANSEITLEVMITFGSFIPGDATLSGTINVLDTTKIERIILGLDPYSRAADANQDGVVDMADIAKVEDIILEVDPVPDAINPLEIAAGNTYESRVIITELSSSEEFTFETGSVEVI